MIVLPVTSPAFSRRSAFHPAWARAVERLLDDGAAPQAPTTRVPAMDVAESDAGYTLAFDLPGIGKEQVKVSIDGRVVAIEASADDAQAVEGVRTLLRERAPARYARKLTLPSDVDAATSQARFDNGVLTLTLVKRVPDGARTLTVQ